MGYGMGVLKGMGITFRHMIESYTIGFKGQPAASGDLPAPSGVKGGMPVTTGGMQTVQYPDEKLPVPERFRYLPFLLYDEAPDHERAQFDGVRCTACGICAKVCPPQCIWIVQGKGDDGKPRPVCTEFYIDSSICMSCGFCAEYCPFDAIKMDHEFELSSYERHESWVYDLQELLHPVAYHAAIHPTDYAREVEETRAKEEAKRQREAAKAAAAAEAGGDAVDPAAAAAAEAEAKRLKMEARERMLAAKKAREQGGG